MRGGRAEAVQYFSLSDALERSRQLAAGAGNRHTGNGRQWQALVTQEHSWVHDNTMN